MNYRHAYHAGNFADVVKHVVLTRIIEYLKRKEAAFRVIDTHAGIGLYDLSSGEAAEDRRMARRHRPAGRADVSRRRWMRCYGPISMRSGSAEGAATVKSLSRLAADRPPAAAQAGPAVCDRTAS